jgi:O-antigen ligase
MNYPLLLAAIVAGVWLPVLLARLPLVVGGALFLVVANCCGPELKSIDTGAMNVALDRVFILVLLAAYIVQRWLRRVEPKPLTLADGVLAALLLLLLAATFLYDWRAVAPPRVPIIPHLIHGYFMPAVLFWIVRQGAGDARHVRAAYGILVLFGVYLAITGLLEAAGQHGLVFPRYIADPQVGIHFGRARGPMVSSVTFGLTLATCVCCGWALWPRFSRPAQLGLLLLLPVALAAIFLSLTRSVWIGTGLALLILSAVSLRGWWRPAVLGGAAAAALLVLATQGERIMAFNRTDNTAAETRESVILRASFTYVSWQMFFDEPLLGFGFGQFPKAKLPYLSDRSTPLHLESIRPYVHHNMLLSLLTELGALGLGLFLLLLWLWGRAGWRLWRRGESSNPLVRWHGLVTLGVLVLYLVQALFHEMSFTPRDHALLFYFAGVTCGLDGAARRATTRHELR